MICRFFRLKLYFVILLLNWYSVNSAIYSSDLVIKLKGDTPNDYFGYSVALQGGDHPRVIIGAPRNGGSIYVCPAIDRDIIKTNDCAPYSINHQHIFNIPNANVSGSLFGATIDGGIRPNDDIMIGAPRILDFDNNGGMYAIGGIFKLSDISKAQFKLFPSYPGSRIVGEEYYSGYAQFGFSLHSIKDSEWLFGAPGFSHWRGEAFYRHETDVNVVPEARNASPRRRVRRSLEERIYHMLNLQRDVTWLNGYAVTSGQFFGRTTYVIGSPNDKYMLGSVQFYSYNADSREMHKEPVKAVQYFMDSLPIGEFFGSALGAADINGDGYDDLLVGAPSAQDGDGYDNGKVYVFLSNTQGDFVYLQKLVGESRSKLGTSISNLGKITLDSHESIAIGCPYENGVGAVRVYVWKDGKLDLDSKIQLNGFSSFGYSLSRAVDIDSNNIADFAVGAYKSNTVAILKAKSVFYYNVAISYSPLYADQDDPNLRITFCISLNGIGYSIATTTKMKLDHRIEQSYVHSETLQISSQELCKSYDLMIIPNTPRFEPLTVNLRLSSKECDSCPVHSPTIPSTFKELIPFNLNCKSEICVPKLNINTRLPTSGVIVVGEQDKHELTVTVRNDGDPAFICKLSVTSTPHVAIGVVNPKRCENTECQYNHIIKEVTQKYQLDFTNWNAYKEHLDLNVSLICVNSTVENHITLKLKYETELKVFPTEITKNYDSSNSSTWNVEADVIFHIRNLGPSSLKEASYILSIPRIWNDEQILNIYKPGNDLCERISEDFDQLEEYQPTNVNELPTAASFGKTTSLSNTVSCDDVNVQCMKIRCRIKSLAKGSTIKFHVPVGLKIPSLKSYRSTFSIQSTLQREDIDKSISITTLYVVDRQTVIDGVAWWIIVLAILVAILILGGTSAALFKFGFFNRAKHEKLMEEMELDKGMEAVSMRNSPEGASSQEGESTLEKL